jgi:HEAT repeat protein
MKRVLLVLAATSVLLALSSRDAPVLAHGGQYRGPAGEVPPNSRDPRDPQPPPEGPATPTPPSSGDTGTPGDGGGPVTPNPEPPKPKTPNGTGPIGDGPGGGERTGTPRAGAPKVMSFDNWLFWWNHNKDEFILRRTAMRAREASISSRGSAHFYGAAGGRNRVDRHPASEKVIFERVVPALGRLIGNRDIHPDIRGGAVIALARCGRPEDVPAILALARPGADEDNLVLESAILSLAMMQVKTPAVREFLVTFLDDMDRPFRARAFAALAIGLLRDDSPEAFAALARRLDGREATLDLPVCALTAIGLIGDEARVADLLRWLEAGGCGTAKFKDLERAHLIGALGRIGSPKAMKAVETALLRGDTLTRRSAVIAFGQILPQAEPAAQLSGVNRLVAALKDEDDNTARGFGLVSIGRLGGADGAPEAVRKAAEAVLLREFRGGPEPTRPFAALALGILAFEWGEEPVKPAEMKYAVIDALRGDLAALRGDKVALGADAIALGLVGERDPDTVKLLVRILDDRGMEKKLRGSAAVALGLIGDLAARDSILRVLEEREDRGLRVDAAIGAGLLGDASAVERLAAILSEPKSTQFVLGSVALALGQIGDARALDGLMAVVEPEKVDGKYPDLTRALAVVAVGQIVDRAEVRVLYRLSKDVNYRASVNALEEVLSIL